MLGLPPPVSAGSSTFCWHNNRSDTNFTSLYLTSSTLALSEHALHTLPMTVNSRRGSPGVGWCEKKRKETDKQPFSVSPSAPSEEVLVALL